MTPTLKFVRTTYGYSIATHLWIVGLVVTAIGWSIPARVSAQLLETPTAAMDSAELARAEKMAQSVTIYRDSYGVPHVYGPTDAACMFGFTYAQAEDYFWQVEDGYIRALARASEWYGEVELANDLINHALDIQGLAQQEGR